MCKFLHEHDIQKKITVKGNFKGAYYTRVCTNSQEFALKVRVLIIHRCVLYPGNRDNITAQTFKYKIWGLKAAPPLTFLSWFSGAENGASFDHWLVIMTSQTKTTLVVSVIYFIEIQFHYINASGKDEEGNKSWCLCYSTNNMKINEFASCFFFFHIALVDISLSCQLLLQFLKYLCRVEISR